jgi:hypothetical protein
MCRRVTTPASCSPFNPDWQALRRTGLCLHGLVSEQPVLAMRPQGSGGANPHLRRSWKHNGCAALLQRT